VDELLIKPLLWLGPLAWLGAKAVTFSPGDFRWREFSKDFLYGLGFCCLLVGEYALALTSQGKGLTITRPPSLLTLFLTSLATGITEEIAFRGFLFRKIYAKTRHNLKANLLVSSLFLILHLPKVLFVNQASLTGVGEFLLISGSLSLVNGYAFYTTKSLVAPITAHTFWNFLIYFLT